MASVDGQVGVIRSEVREVVALVERAQAIAARVVQKYNKLGGAAFFAEEAIEWPEDCAQAEFVAAVASLGTLFPDILGNHGTNFYKVF